MISFWMPSSVWLTWCVKPMWLLLRRMTRYGTSSMLACATMTSDAGISSACVRASSSVLAIALLRATKSSVPDS